VRLELLKELYFKERALSVVRDSPTDYDTGLTRIHLTVAINCLTNNVSSFIV